MKRVIIHWSAGHYSPSESDLSHYHFVIDGMGKVHPGKFPVVANEAPQKGRYAAHTLDCNTGSIGVAIAAMAGAQERPFNRGSAPILQAQLAALAQLCAKLGRDYSIPVTRETMLTHAEVQPTLGIRQRGKWDIAWLPGMTTTGDPVAVGDTIRAMIRHGYINLATPTPERANHTGGQKPSLTPVPPKPSKAPAIGAALVALLVAVWAWISKG